MANGKKTASKKKVSKKKTSSKRKDLQVHKKNEVAVSLSNDPAIAMIQVLERAVLNPKVDVDKMERIFEMQLKVIKRNAEIEFNQAMSIAQSEVGFINTDLENGQTHSKYASYVQMDRALRPVYTKNGFALSFNTEPTEKADMVRVICYVTHKAGHTRNYSIDMPADGKGAKGGDVMTKTHATGAASSYGMRYLLKLIFNVAIGEDDTDGNMPLVEEIIYISEDQSNSLYAKIDEHGVNKAGFYKWLKSEMKLTKLEDVPANRFDHVNNRIDSAIRAIES